MKHLNEIQTALKNRWLSRPSVQYCIPTESIPGNGIISVKFSGYFCSFYRHLIVKDSDTLNNFSTEISVVSFATENTICKVTYVWNKLSAHGRQFPPWWVHLPTLQVCDLGLSTKYLAFGTIENMLLLVTFPLLSHNLDSRQVLSFDFSEIIVNYHGLVKSERVCIVLSESYICMVVQGRTRANVCGTIILLVETHVNDSPVIYHFVLCRPLNVSHFTQNNILTRLNSNSLVLTLQYQDSLHQPRLKLIHLRLANFNSSIDNVFTKPSAPDYEISVHFKHFVFLDTMHKRSWQQSADITLLCKNPITMAGGYLTALNSLARSLSRPFFSLVASDTSKIGILSARLNSPWAMPVALMHLLLFIVSVPFLLLPEYAMRLSVSESSIYGLIIKKQYTFLFRKGLLSEGPFFNFYELVFRGGKNLFAIVCETHETIVIQKFTPTPLSETTYLQVDSLRKLSVFCYLFCLVTFVISMLLIFKTLPSAKIDFIVEFSILDAASVYLLAICQDLVMAYALVQYKMKAFIGNFQDKARTREDDFINLQYQKKPF